MASFIFILWFVNPLIDNCSEQLPGISDMLGPDDRALLNQLEVQAKRQQRKGIVMWAFNDIHCYQHCICSIQLMDHCL